MLIISPYSSIYLRQPTRARLIESNRQLAVVVDSPAVSFGLYDGNLPDPIGSNPFNICSVGVDLQQSSPSFPAYVNSPATV